MSAGEWIESHLSSLKWITSFLGWKHVVMHIFCVLKGLWEWIYVSNEFHSAKQTLYGRVSVDWWIKWFSMATNQCVCVCCFCVRLHAVKPEECLLTPDVMRHTSVRKLSMLIFFFHICVNHLSVKNKLLFIVQCWIFCMFVFHISTTFWFKGYLKRIKPSIKSVLCDIIQVNCV